jgi:pimeloyl-ACP methyl ester carboxylesterase
LIGKWAFSESAEIKLVELAQSRMAETPHQVVHQDFQACDQFNMMEQLHEVKSPALILCGEEDQLTPIKYGSYLADKLPTAYMETVPDAGHMVMLERPADLEKHIRGFFRTTFG